MAEDLGSDTGSAVESRLNVLIWLYLDQKYETPTAKITKLSELGLKAADIAAIVGKPGNYVNAVLSNVRKAGGKKGKVGK